MEMLIYFLPWILQDDLAVPDGSARVPPCMTTKDLCTVLASDEKPVKAPAARIQNKTSTKLYIFFMKNPSVYNKYVVLSRLSSAADF